VLDVLGTEACVAPGLQETPGQVLSRTYSCGEGLAEQAAALDQLGQRVGELQQQVEDLGRDRVEQTDGQMRETLLEPVGQSVEGFEFTVLLGGDSPGFSMNSVIREHTKPSRVTSLASRMGW